MRVLAVAIIIIIIIIMQGNAVSFLNTMNTE